VAVRGTFPALQTRHLPSINYLAKGITT